MSKLNKRRHQLVRLIEIFIIALLVMMQAGCAYDSFHYPDSASVGRSGVDHKPEVSPIPSQGVYRVVSGDTLFSIAFRYGLDYRELASYNHIESPYVIYPNQKIRLTAEKKPTAKVATTNTHTKPSSKKSTKQAVKSENENKTKPKTPVVQTVTPVNVSPKTASNSEKTVKNIEKWRWPVVGTVVRGFSNAGVSSKGIDIKGRIDQVVVAAADGMVVYAGNGLIGYGNLVIVKHNDEYLSAYAYNQRILVKEKQTVQAGDTLAVIGNKGAEKALLHFEIRRDGQPVDPLKILPTI